MIFYIRCVSRNKRLFYSLFLLVLFLAEKEPSFFFLIRIFIFDLKNDYSMMHVHFITLFYNRQEHVHQML